MAEGARLESVYAGNRIAGSNPALSARREKVTAIKSWPFLFSQKNRDSSQVRSPGALAGIYSEKATQGVAQRSSRSHQSLSRRQPLKQNCNPVVVVLLLFDERRDVLTLLYIFFHQKFNVFIVLFTVER